MDLAKVGLQRILRNTRPMLEGLATMRIPIYTEALQQANAARAYFGEGVGTAPRNGKDLRGAH